MSIYQTIEAQAIALEASSHPSDLEVAHMKREQLRRVLDNAPMQRADPNVHYRREVASVLAAHKWHR